MSTLRQRFLASVGQTSPSPMLIEVARAQGVYLYTADGRRYFDLVSGVSVCNVGHSNPVVVEAVASQAADYMHTMVYGETVQRVQVEYAQCLASALGMESVYFVSTGAEAIEGALKLAKRATGRGELISMQGGYHGSSHGALSIQGGETYKSAFRPLLPDTRTIRFNSFDDLRFITFRTACVVTEIVQGEAGVRLPVDGYLEALRLRCDQVGALLVVDEIQTGIGRVGSIFACDKYGVRADIVCLAKALGGGLPLGAFVSSRELMACLQSAPVLGHITTFGGNPVCCAAGLASFGYVRDHNLASSGDFMGALFAHRLLTHPLVLEIRRSGLLLAVELGCSDRLFALMSRFAEVGIMSDWFLFCDTSFRISPPLTITVDEVEGACELILSSLDYVGGL